MRVEDIFPPEVIDEDIKKFMGGAMAAAAIAASPMAISNLAPKDTMEASVGQSIAILAQTMWGEARSHGKDGMLAVGYVIKNRASAGKPDRFGAGIKGVALKRKQFSCWNSGDPNRARMTDMQNIDKAIKTKTAPEGETSYDEWFETFKLSNDYRDYIMWREAFDLAKKIVYGQVQDPTQGAVFYHTTGVKPRWSIGATPISKIANHVFYQTVN